MLNFRVHIILFSLGLTAGLLSFPLQAMFTIGAEDVADGKGKESVKTTQVSPSLPVAASSAAAVPILPVIASSAATTSRAEKNVSALLPSEAHQHVAAAGALFPRQMNPSGVFAVPPEGGDNLPIYQGEQLAVGAGNDDDNDNQPHPPALQCALEDVFHGQSLLDLLVRDTIPPDVRVVMSGSEFAELQSGITYLVLSRIGAPLGDRKIGLCDFVTGSAIQKCFIDPASYKEAQRRIAICRGACKANAPQPLNLEGFGLSFLPGKFGKLKGLTDLNLARNPTLLSFERLSLLTSLTRLNLFETGLASLTPLKPLINLRELGLGNNFLGSVEGIEGFVLLEVLDISHNKVPKLDPLAPLKALKILSVEGNPLTVIGTLKNLPLTTLNVGSRDEMVPFKDDLEALLAKGCNIIYKGKDEDPLLKAVTDDLKSLGSEVKTWIGTVNATLNQWWNQI